MSLRCCPPGDLVDGPWPHDHTSQDERCNAHSTHTPTDPPQTRGWRCANRDVRCRCTRRDFVSRTALRPGLPDRCRRTPDACPLIAVHARHPAPGGTDQMLHCIADLMASSEWSPSMDRADGVTVGVRTPDSPNSPMTDHPELHALGAIVERSHRLMPSPPGGRRTGP